MKNSLNLNSSAASPPGQVLDLVAYYLDPKSLAIASCVSKSWSVSLSSDHLWKPICSTHFPSLLSTFPSSASPPLSLRRLFTLGHTASKLRTQTALKPTQLSLSNLIFTITVISTVHNSTPLARIVKSGHELALAPNPNSLFKFEIKIGENEQMECCEDLEGVKIVWNVVLEGWKGVFTMMDCEVKVNFSPDVAVAEGWFSEELPCPGCCSSEGTSGIIADLKMGFEKGSGEKGGMRVNKVSVGILSVVSWGYVGLDDGFRYLQHFLLPF